MSEQALPTATTPEMPQPKTATVKARLKAAGIHIAISTVIFLVFLYFILAQWYPIPYFVTDGGWQGIRIVIAVDMVLGPLLTLIIFNPAKSRRAILFDLSMIGLAQFAALVWGAYAVYSQQPAAVIQWEGSLRSVTLEQLWERDIQVDMLRGMSAERPPVIYGRYPPTIEGKKALLERANKGIAPILQTELYHPVPDFLDEFFEIRLDIEKVTADNPNVKQEFNTFLADNKLEAKDLYFMYFRGRYKNSILVFDKKGKVVGALHSPF
jgi:hypothetical protein